MLGALRPRLTGRAALAWLNAPNAALANGRSPIRAMGEARSRVFPTTKLSAKDTMAQVVALAKSA